MVEHTSSDTSNEVEGEVETTDNEQAASEETAEAAATEERKAVLEITPGMDVYPQHLRMLDGAHVSNASGVGPMEIWVSYGAILEGGESEGAFRRKRVGWDEARRLQELAREIDGRARAGKDASAERAKLMEIAVMPNADILSAAEALAEVPREGRATLIRRCLRAVEEGGGAEELERAVVLAGQVQNDDVQAPREVLEVSIWLLANHGEPAHGLENALGWMLQFDEESHGLTGLVAACDELFRAMTGRRPSSTYHSRVDRAGALRFRVDALAAAGEAESASAETAAGAEADSGNGASQATAYVAHPDEEESVVTSLHSGKTNLTDNVDSLVVQLREAFGEDLQEEAATHQDLDRIVDVIAQTRRDIQRVRQESLTLRSRIEQMEAVGASRTSVGQPGSGASWNNIMLILTVALFVGALLLVWNESQDSSNTAASIPGATGPTATTTSGQNQTESSEPSAAEVRTSPVEMPGEGSATEAAEADEIKTADAPTEENGKAEASAEANAEASAEASAEIEAVEPVAGEATEEAAEAQAEEAKEAESVLAAKEATPEPAEEAAVAEEEVAVAEEASEPKEVAAEEKVSAEEARELAAERYGVGINPSHRLISRSKLYRFGDRDFIPVTDLPGGDALVNACILSKAPVSAYRSRLYRGFTAIRLSCAGEMKVVCEILGCPAEQSCVTSASWVKPCK